MSDSLYTPPGYDWERTQRTLRENVGRVVRGDDGNPYTVVRVGGEDVRIVPVQDALAKSTTEAAHDRAGRSQPYRAAELPGLTGMFTGVKETQNVYRSQFELLREIVRRNAMVASVIRKRQSQVSAFASRPRYDGDVGFRVAARDRKAPVTTSLERKCAELEDLLLRGGYYSDHPRTGQRAVWNAEGSLRAPGFARLLRTLIWDSLVIDAGAIHFEEGLNAKRYPIVWMGNLDAGLIRYAVTKDQGRDATQDSRVAAQFIPYQPEVRPTIDAEYVMLDVMGSGIQREFAWNELAYLVRNPRTEQKVQGYGFPELEMLIDIVTGILFGVRFNVSYFNENKMPPGILNLVGGEWAPHVLESFRQQMRMMCSGPNQWWTLPILTTDSPQAAAQYTPLRSMDGVGMFWKEFLLFCAAILCALYGMDSSEINAVNFGTSSNSLANPQPIAKISYAQESGLEPLMQILADFFNEYIVWRIDPSLIFEWVGLSWQDANEERAARQDRMAWALSTPNAERARRDEEPIYDPVNRELWLATREKVAEHLNIDPMELDRTQDRDQRELLRRAYERGGGQWAQWPDAPVGNPSALQIWMQEHPMGQAGEGMGGEEEQPGEEDQGQEGMGGGGEEQGGAPPGGGQPMGPGEQYPPAFGQPSDGQQYPPAFAQPGSMGAQGGS